MEKVWLSKYPDGIPHEINPDRYTSLVELVDSAVAKYGDKAAFESFGQVLSFQEVGELSDYFAAYLQNYTDLQPGDRIAIQMPNLLQFPIAFFGALKAGLVIVNTNPLYTAWEMKHQFRDSGAKAIVICANFADKLEDILSETSIKNVITTEIGDLLGIPKRWIVNTVIRRVKKMVPKYSLPQAVGFLETLKKGKESKFEKAKMGSDAIAFLQYTGGTTGVAKGAMLTHRNILANMEQIFHWMVPKLREGEEVIITPLPLYHIFSLTVNFISFFQFGGKNVLITNPRDIPDFVKRLAKEDFTVMTGVNTLYNALMNNAEFQQIDFKKLKIAVAGGMALQVAVAKRWQEVTGTALLEGYGLTEASPVVACNPVIGENKIGTIGMPLPSTEIKIVKEDGSEAGTGEPGELYVRGPQVMKGYWQKEKESAQVLDSEGWLHSGDMAAVGDDGFVKIVDRKKDMILVSGFNVYPNEVEDVIADHPAVVEVGVIGHTDTHSGEVVAAYIVAKNTSLTEAEIVTHCKERLTSYKVPKLIFFRDELPKTNVGKILRRELK